MKSRLSTPYTTKMYSGFSGLTTARSEIAMERPEAQPLATMDGLYCSSKGYITNEPGFSRVGDEQAYVSHVRYHDAETGVLVYAARMGNGTSLRCLRGYGKAESTWPKDAVISSAYFNRNLFLAAGDVSMRQYNGADFTHVSSDSIKGGRYVCQVSNRLVVAGFDDNVCTLQMSRVNDATRYVSDESSSDASVLKAAYLDIQNVIGSGDRIRGISSFESNKLAIFTRSSTLIYSTDPDYTKWAIDPSAMIRHGTISHNSIVQVGGDLFFCSDSGVHSMRRSVINGSTIFSSSISEDITELYQHLLSMVKVKSSINASYDPVGGRLHIFFPVNDKLSYRLSAAMADARTEQDITKVTWSMSSAVGMTCADYQAGHATHGSISGVQEALQWFDASGSSVDGTASLPTLWHEDLFNIKQSLHMVLYASGHGTVTVSGRDETGRELSTVRFELPEKDQTDYAGVPLQRQFIRPFAHSYTGLKLSWTMARGSAIRIFAIGVNIQSQKKG